MMKSFFGVIALPILIVCLIMSDGTTSGTHSLWDDPMAVHVAEAQKAAVKVRIDVTMMGVDVPDRVIKDYSTGSGIVVENDESTSAVLTAAHVCDAGIKEGDVTIGSGTVMIARDIRIYVTTHDMRDIDAEVIKIDKAVDLCLLRVRGSAGHPTHVSPFEPPVGATVTYVGAPDGIWRGVPVALTGLYNGKISVGIRIGLVTFEGFAQYTIPIVGGASGGGVYYRGMLIGMATIKRRGFENVAWGPSLPDINRFIRDGV